MITANSVAAYYLLFCLLFYFTISHCIAFSVAMQSFCAIVQVLLMVKVSRFSFLCVPLSVHMCTSCITKYNEPVTV